MNQVLKACISALVLVILVGNYPAMAQNQVLDLSNESAYLDLGTGHDLKPTEAISFGFWAYHQDWLSVQNKPTLLGNTQHIGFGIGLTSDLIQVWISIDSVYQNVNYPTSMLQSGWHHFVCSFNGEQILLAINGRLVDRSDLPRKSLLMQPDTTISLMVGVETRYNSQPYPGYYFDGLMDDVFISQSAFDANQLEEIYQSGINADDPDLLLYLPFEGGLETAFTDQSSFDHQVSALNEPMISKVEIPKVLPFLEEDGWVILTLIFAVAYGTWYITKGKGEPRLWVGAFWSISILSYCISQPLCLSWLNDSLQPAFWNNRLADFIFVGSLSLLFKAYATAYSNRLAVWSWIALGAISIVVLVLPVDLRSSVVLIVTLLTAILLVSLAAKLDKKLVVLGGLALILGGILQLLDVLGHWNLYAYTPLNNLFSWVFMGFGVIPLMNFKQVKQRNISEQLLEILSAKETEVFELLLDGKTDAQISEQMSVTTNTVKTYNKRIYSKLGVSGRRELSMFVED